MLHRIVWDIETASLEESEISKFMPTEWAIGNIKDPDKIKAAIEEKKKKWLSDAALHAETCKVIAIGYWIKKGDDVSVMLRIDPNGERDLIVEFWEIVRSQSGTAQFVGFNCKRFDLAVLCRRSWKLGVPVPSGLIRRRYWSDEFVDLYEEWQLGDYQASISLDNLSKFLGIGQKNGSGADFAGLPRDKQEEYLLNDITLTAKAAELMLPKL